MAQNNFILDLIAGLQKARSKNQIKADIKAMGDINIPLTPTITTAKINNIAQIIKKAVSQAEEITKKNNITINVDDLKLDNVINKLKQISQINTTIDTESSVNAINKEAKSMLEIIDSAKKAALEKLEFAEANREVRESADNTVDAIIRERNAMNSLNDINYILDNVNMNAEQGESVFRRFGNTLNEAFATYTVANLLEDAIYEVIDAGKEGIEVVKELNDVATSLRMATGDSLKETNALVDSYNDLGQELGAITSDVSESADAWLRQGHSIEDTNTLITDSMMLSKIANLESAESTEYLTSIMQAYKLTANKVIDTVSKLSAVDLESASDAGGLAKSMSRCASAAEMAGVSMDTLIGYIATVKEVTQDSDEAVGNMFKSVFSRMNQIRAGKFVDLETGEALNDTEKVLNKIGIVTRDVNNQLIDSEQILNSIGKSWKTYDSNTQKALATAVAGTYQYNKFIALMQSYDEALNYANISANSQGVAEEKFGYYLDSLEAKTNSLQASLENLATTTLSDELYGSVLETSKAIVDLIADTDVLKGLLIGLGTSGGIYAFRQVTSSLGDITQGFANLSEAMSMTRGGTVSIDNMQRLIDLTGGLSQSQTRLLLSTNNLTDAQKIAILVNQNMAQGMNRDVAEATARATLNTWGLTTAQNGATGATVTLTNSLRGLWSTLMANPLILVTSLVTAGVMAIEAYNKKVEEARQKAKEAAEESASYVEKLLDLKKQIEEGTTSTEDLTTAFREQMRAMGYTETQIDSLIKKYGNLAGVIDEATREALENAKTDAYADVSLASKALVSSSNGGLITDILIEDFGTGDDVLDNKIREILSEVATKTANQGNTWISKDNSAEGLYAYYNALKEVSRLIQETASETNDESLLNLGNAFDSTVYGEITEAIDKLSESAEAYGDAIGRLHSADAQLELADYLKTNDINSQEAFDSYVEGIKNSTEYSEAYKQVLLGVVNDAFPQFIGQVIESSDALDDFSDKTVSISFDTYFNSEDFKEHAEILKELAISGELSPKTFATTKAYMNLLEQTGLTAEEAIEKIRGIAVADSSLSDIMSSMQSQAKLINEVESEIADSGQISFDTLQNIASEYPSLERYVTDYLNGVEGAEKNLINALEEQYNRDLDNYREYYILKQQNDEGWYTNYLYNISNWVVDLASQYGIDLKNYANYLQAKAGLEEELENARVKLNEAKANREKSQSIMNNNPLGNVPGIYNPASSYYDNEVSKAQDAYDNIKKIYNDIIKEYENSIPDVDYTWKKYLTGNYVGGAGNTSSSKDVSDTAFDWIETRLSNLNEALDETKKKAEDTFNGWTIRDNAFIQAITDTEALIKEQENARKRYLEEANKSGLSNGYKILVQKGAIDIDKLSNNDPLKEQIESYQEWYEKAKQCDEEIKQLKLDLDSLSLDKRALKWEVFDYLEESISRITDEANHLIELFRDEDLFGDNGKMTSYGDAMLALHLSNLATYQQQAKDYAEEIKDLEKDLATGGQEVLDKYNERVDSHRDMISAIKSEQQAIIDLVEDGYKKQLDYLNEIIDKKKSSLSAEKDLYNYQKSIQEKADKVSSLQKQYDVYKNNTASEEDRLKAQQLKVELDAAMEDLQQTQYEKMVDDTEKMLDALSSEYEGWISQKLDNSDSLLQGIIDKVSSEGESINATLKEIASKYGTTVSDNIITSVNGDYTTAINNLINGIAELLGGNATLIGNVGGYASGTLSATKGLHWFGEKGDEIIIRKSDGAMLGDFGNGDVVISNGGAKLLAAFAENPSAFTEKFGLNNFVQPLINVNTPTLPKIQPRVMPNVTFGDVNISLPNVRTPEDFSREFKQVYANNIGKIRNMIQDDIGNSFLGRNSLEVMKNR